ncbi:MAG: hypothetical protein JWL89_643 [Candidatus Saccharibacteria bacterium]|nr:hypothetical protein [Candidatus Saccharibacteria bacterium]
MSTEPGPELQPEPENILGIAIEELDEKNTLFFSAIYAWKAQPSYENLNDIALSGVEAGVAFRNVVETVLQGEIAETVEEKATLLAGVFTANQQERVEELKKITPQVSYQAPLATEELAREILNDLEQDIVPDVICSKLIQDFLGDLNEDVRALCSTVARSKKGRLYHAWERSREPLAEFGKHTAATTLGVTLAGIILKKMWEQE